MGVCVFVFVGLLPCTITRNCDNSKLRASILKVKVVTSDHLQLIKFWPSRNPGKGVCGGAKIFGSALLQPARSLCVSLGAFSLCLFHSSMFFRDHVRDNLYKVVDGLGHIFWVE